MLNEIKSQVSKHEWVPRRKARREGQAKGREGLDIHVPAAGRGNVMAHLQLAYRLGVTTQCSGGNKTKGSSRMALSKRGPGFLRQLAVRHVPSRPGCSDALPSCCQFSVRQREREDNTLVGQQALPTLPATPSPQSRKASWIRLFRGWGHGSMAAGAKLPSCRSQERCRSGVSFAFSVAACTTLAISGTWSLSPFSLSGLSIQPPKASSSGPREGSLSILRGTATSGCSRRRDNERQCFASLARRTGLSKLRSHLEGSGVFCGLIITKLSGMVRRRVLWCER